MNVIFHIVIQISRNLWHLPHLYCTISTGENTIPIAKSVLYVGHPCMSALHIFSPSHISAALFSLFLCDDFLYGSLLPLQELRTMSSLGY